MMKQLFTFSFLLLIQFVGYSQFSDSASYENADPSELFRLGNEAYMADDYKGSINIYMAILDKNVESADLYFNLGNAYFKTGDIPNALLFYEKAKRLSPDDEDIRTNIDIANLKTVDKVETKPELPFTAWWKEMLNSNLIDEWAYKSIYLSLAGFVLMLIFLFTSGLVKKISFFAAIFIFACSLTFYFLGELQKSDYTNSQYGIIFSSSVTVKSSPENDGTTLFVIHEGTKIEILELDGDWAEISLMNGNKGWVKSETYKNI